MASNLGMTGARPDPSGPCAGRTVIICEDHAITRWGLREYCRKLGCDVVRETSLGEEAIELVDAYRPDLLILDQELPGRIEGQEVQRMIRARQLPTKVLVITSHDDKASFFDWIQRDDGPDGVLTKVTSVLEIETAIVHVLTQDTKYIPASVWSREQRDTRNPLAQLAPHELRVLRDVALGYPPRDIATRQSLSIRTVRSYMTQIYSKLGLMTNSMPAAAAVYHKWVSADPDVAARVEKLQ